MDANKNTARAAALLPIGVFLVLYLGMGLVFEYILKIEMGFYNIPIVVVFMVALLVACLQNRALSFDRKLEVMAQGVGNKDILTMILIFLAAGVFVGVTGIAALVMYLMDKLASGTALFAVLAGLIVAFIVVGALIGQLKQASSQRAASDYEKKGSFNLHVKYDHFLYQNETRRKIETNNNKK